MPPKSELFTTNEAYLVPIDGEVAEKIMLQATRDNHYKVRLEAIEAIKVNEIKSAVPYLIYRAKNDPENVVKKSAWPVIASLNTNEGNEFLVNQIKEEQKDLHS